MPGSLLVASQISSLFPPSHAASITVQTTRLNVPLPAPAKESDPPPEHAVQSSVLHSQLTGTILLRVLHSGIILELLALSVNVTPLRFIFPAPILPAPGIFFWEGALHVIAATVSGSIYRIVVPVADSKHLWQSQISNIWPREYLVKNFNGALEGLVHVHGTHCVVIGLPTGSMLRFDTEDLDEDVSEYAWVETLFQNQGSLLSTLTSFLSTGPTAGSAIISIATHPWPTDSGDAWTLSRDRVLRVWKPKLGCVATKRLPQIPGRDITPVPSGAATPSVLMEPSYRTLIRIFTLDQQSDSFILVFLPTPSSSVNGGAFLLLNSQLLEIRSISCSSNSRHCHLQDFIVVEGQLYLLWDRQGQAMVEATTIDLDHDPDLHDIWDNASYAPEPELTPAYLEEILLTQGSLNDRFFEVTMRPGMFSALTLRTAMDQYTDACLSIPGPAPPQLMTSYGTLGENIAAVVGCTVRLNRDPRTGSMLYDSYWNALKRDWEGFIARCREIERGARWPLILGARGKGDIIVVERERVGELVPQDPTIYLCNALAHHDPNVDPQYVLLSLMWGLRSKLGLRVLRNLEDQMMELMHQETAFSLADIVKDQSLRCNFRGELDDGELSWIEGRLLGIGDLDEAINAVLNTLGGFDVKREDEEGDLAAIPLHSEWSKSLTASYLVTTINARYDLCICMVTLFYFISDDAWEKHGTLLAEVFAVFRGLTMLRLSARQPASSISHKAPVAETAAADDVVSLMRNMAVSKSQSLSSPNVSLLHRLLAHFGDNNYVLPGAAHHFIDATGLLRSISPARATSYEVGYCERLRVLGNHDVAREILSWLPRTPGITYVLARLWLNVGRADDAAFLLEKLAGSFGPYSAVAADDRTALLSVLPNREFFETPMQYYLHVAMLFKSHFLIHQEIHFTQLAISVATPDIDTSTMWQTVIRGYIDLAHYDDAYAAWVATPYESMKQDSLTPLVYRMCEDDAIQQLTTFNFADFADEVESILSFKARNTDPRLTPNYSRILYSWYTIRGDYRNAALSMYQRARKLHSLIVGNPSLVNSLADEELNAYLTAMNALSLVDSKNAWLLTTGTAENDRSSQLTKHIPESKFSPGKQAASVVHLADIEYNYTLLSAQIDLIRDDPTLLSAPEFLLPPASIVLRLALMNHFDHAMSAARTFKADMSDIFAHLTKQCLKLSRDPEIVLQEDTYEWLLTDKISSWHGSPADRGWRYLRQSLERHDSQETDYAYTKTAFETMLTFQKSSPPPWIVRSLEEHHHEFLIRIHLRYENFNQAIEHTLSLIRKADARLARDQPKNAAATWLPYTLIDQLLVAAAANETTLPQLGELRNEIGSRVKKMQNLSQFK